MNKSDLIEYICQLLNISLDSDLVYMDISNSLDTVKDLPMFQKDLKSRVANLNDNYKYLNGFQKFVKFMDEYEKKILQLSDNEYDKIDELTQGLYKKLCWYFDELKWHNPTKEQLKRQVWKTHQYHGKDMINDKESKICDTIGDTGKIYRLAVSNKPKLETEIKKIATSFVYTRKKQDNLIGYKDDENKIDGKMMQLLNGNKN